MLRALLRALLSTTTLATGLLATSLAGAQDKPPLQPATFLPLREFSALTDAPEPVALESLQRITAAWNDAYAPMLIEAVYFAAGRRVQAAIQQQMERVAGRPFAGSLDPWYHWLWGQQPGEHPDYAEFKAALYERIDPRFREYFGNRPRAIIRLDEIRWGGVHRDGIPPLEAPKMIRAREAKYLQDGNIVFGVAIDGDVRAYPQRILAWHEMFKDRIAGREINGVYCTLCGTMIVYEANVGGVHHELGTAVSCTARTS